MRAVLTRYQEMRREVVEGFTADVQDSLEKLPCIGCTEPWCCYQLPLAHPLEGIVIADALLRAGRIDLLQAAAVQGEAQMAVLQQTGMMSGDLCTEAELDQLMHGWYNRSEPCVFLENGKCAVYDQRPVCCSTYFTQTPCKRKYAADEMVPTANNRQAIEWNLMMASYILGQALGEDVLYAPLSLPATVASDWTMRVLGVSSCLRT